MGPLLITLDGRDMAGARTFGARGNKETVREWRFD
jgi:hypothetical protein